MEKVFFLWNFTPGLRYKNTVTELCTYSTHFDRESEWKKKFAVNKIKKETWKTSNCPRFVVKRQWRSLWDWAETSVFTVEKILWPSSLFGSFFSVGQFSHWQSQAGRARAGGCFTEPVIKKSATLDWRLPWEPSHNSRSCDIQRRNWNHMWNVLLLLSCKFNVFLSFTCHFSQLKNKKWTANWV